MRIWLVYDRQILYEDKSKTVKGPTASIKSPQPPELETHLRNGLEGDYRFTRDGALLLSNFQSPITPTGLAGAALQAKILAQGSPSDVGGDSPRAVLVLSDKDGCNHGVVDGVVTPMKEQVVFLGKLGEGSAGVVYRAFDLFDLRLVAVKVIPVRDDTKRQQLVHELSSLYDGLINRRRRLSDHSIIPPSSKSSRAEMFRLARQHSWPLEGSQTHTPPTPLNESEHLLAPIDVYVTTATSTLSLIVEYMDGGSLQVCTLCLLRDLGYRVVPQTFLAGRRSKHPPTYTMKSTARYHLTLFQLPSIPYV